MPFEIPDSWVWCRLNDIASISAGGTPERHNPRFWANGTIPWLKISDITSANKYIKQASEYITEEGLKNSSAKILPKGTLLYTIFATIGEVGILDFDASCNQAIAGVQLFNTAIRDYLYYYLINLQAFMMSISKGCAQFNINQKILKAVFVPLPPLAEQVRIVAKIEKFEPLIAEYDKLEQQASKLDEEIYDKLKKSILQYAIQGKLVPQDPNDEPASVLLERIRAEKKAKLGKKYVDSCIYKGDDNCYYEKVGRNEPVRLEDLPFEIPDSWCWARLKDVTFNHGQKIPNIAFSYIDIGSIDNVNQKLSAKENIVEPEKAPSRARKIVERGDVLYATVRPYLHNMCVVEKDFSLEPIASTGFAVLAVERGIKNTFLFYYMLSPVFDQYANSSENSKGVAYPAINDEKLYKAPIPIPPQNEQQNICKLIDKCFNVLMLKDEG